jgi:hypothetical protein
LSDEVISSVMWSRHDLPGAEVCTLRRTADGWMLTGSALTAFDSGPAISTYRIECDDQWRTRGVHVSVTRADVRRDLAIACDENGTWTRDGMPEQALRGCIDVDLEVSPCTNTLPLRRCPIGPGQAIEPIAAWVRFPELTIEPLAQRYTCRATGQYLYESHGGRFRSEIATDLHGLVTEYGDLWKRVG